jgi:hypothetical protein
VPLLKIRIAEIQLYGGQLSLPNPHQKVAATAGRLQKPGVDTVGLIADKVQHGVHHPARGEYLAMVDNALFGLDQIHTQSVADTAFSAKGNLANGCSYKTDGPVIWQADQRVNGCR